MKVAALVHFSMPDRNCGSETVLQELMAAAVRAGHEATVYVTHKDARRMWTGREPDSVVDGVRIVRIGNPLIGVRRIRGWAPDVIVTHHQHAVFAIKTARQIGARSVFLTHNPYDLNMRPLRSRPDLVIHNSDHVAETLNSKFGVPRAQMVFHPPLTPDRHRVPSTGEAVTLINLNKDKGADLFYRLAQLEPDRKFVGVVGGHGDQIIRRNLPNVEILEHGPDMKRVWSRTRVLLMPSVAESYGLTAVEAGINGIPTIAHPTDGLKENLGPDGLYADRDSPAEWQQLLARLDDPANYQPASQDASRLAELAMSDTREAISRWLDWIG